MSARLTKRFLFVIASSLFAYFCISRHSMSTNYLTGLLPTVSTLFAIGSLQSPSSLASHAPSTSLQLLRRYASVLVGVAILGQHAVEAELKVVNKTTFKDTWYNGSAVSINGPNILITLDKHADRANVTWRFNSAWQFQLEKCDGSDNAKFIIADSCKWEFDWDETKRFTLSVDEDNTWKFPKKNETTPRMRKLRLEIADESPPTMSICAVPDKGECPTRDLFGPTKLFQLNSPQYCMLTTGTFSVNMTLTHTEPSCPVNMNAQLLYDFPEPTTTPAATVSQNDGRTTTLPLWTGDGPAPSGYATRPWTSTTEAPPGFPTWAIIVASVGGFLVLLAIIGIVCLIVFCYLPRRRRQQAQFCDDADIQALVAGKEKLVEWDDVMAHAAYKPKLDKPPDEKDWPFKTGDTVDLSTVNGCCPSYYSDYKELKFMEDVKGVEDYGVVEGKFNNDDGALIYYSRPPARLEAFLIRLSRLNYLDTHHDRMQPSPYIPRGPALVPTWTHYWISPDPKKMSYVIVEEHGDSVAQVVKEGTEFHERVGFAYTTFAALVRLHRYGCVHRDVTPAAFVVRNKQTGDDQCCYITHLSLARMPYDIIEKTWRPRRRRVNYFGTHKYASRAAHAMQERSFKDDLESWFFTAVELIWPTTAKESVMPWHIFNLEIGVTDRAELHAKYKAEKEKFLRNFSKNKLIVSFPAPQFRIFAKEILKMTYETLETDYQPGFLKLLDGMMDQLPTQVDEASQKDFVDYMQSFNANQCRLAAKYGQPH